MWCWCSVKWFYRRVPGVIPALATPFPVLARQCRPLFLPSAPGLGFLAKKLLRLTRTCISNNLTCLCLEDTVFSLCYKCYMKATEVAQNMITAGTAWVHYALSMAALSMAAFATSMAA